jgi:hypothetical protein
VTRSISATNQAQPGPLPCGAGEGRGCGQADEQVGRLLEAMQTDQELRAICLEHDLWPHLKTFIESAWTAFRPIHEMHAEIDVDPDTDERRIVVDVSADASVAKMRRRYDEFTHSVVPAVPADKREWMRLAFQPLRDE